MAIGQRATAVRRVIEAVQQHGAPERCVFVVASAAASPGLQWIAPFAGFTIAEYFRDHGQHALIVVDDLTKHAATHRELALLTREPPGREAYPGDIFYLHSRMLERSAKLSAELGGGSLTALPIAETDAGNLSAYIPTNLISITDGQIVLDSHLFAANQRPAVDVGLSVSRVGGKAQTAAMRSGLRPGPPRLCAISRTGNVHPLWRSLGRARQGADHPRRAHPSPAHPASFRRSASRRRGGAACGAGRWGVRSICPRTS